MLSESLKSCIVNALKEEGQITFLVGAGVSAESGIPTFRGPEGFWQVGSTNYTPQEIGTYDMFLKQPLEVWKWFLFRKTICRQAEPNAGHDALVAIEEMLGDKFALITQNVDGLHTRAGNSAQRMYAIHGDLSYARCGAECSEELYPFPDHISKQRGEDLTEQEIASLKCPKCGDFLRPHVLWFDEYYNEKYYKSTSAMYVAYHTNLIFIIGTSGATSLPHKIVQGALGHSGAAMVVIDPHPNIFSEVAEDYEKGHVITAKSADALTAIMNFMKETLQSKGTGV